MTMSGLRGFPRYFIKLWWTSLRSPWRINFSLSTFCPTPDARRIVDPHYLSGGRSADFVLFHIFAGKPRSAQQKKRLYRRLCDRLQAELGIAPDDVMVVIQFNHTDDWSFSRGEMLAGQVEG